MSESAEWTKPKRPLGVWVITVSIGISAGVVPLGLILYMWFDEGARSAMQLNLTHIISSVILGIAIGYYSFRTWAGDDNARKILLGLVALHWGMIIFNNAQILMSEDVMAMLSDEQRRKPYANVFRSIFWLAIIYGYFLSNRPRAFFKGKADANKSSDSGQ